LAHGRSEVHGGPAGWVANGRILPLTIGSPAALRPALPGSLL